MDKNKEMTRYDWEDIYKTFDEHGNMTHKIDTDGDEIVKRYDADGNCIYEGRLSFGKQIGETWMGYEEKGRMFFKKFWKITKGDTVFEYHYKYDNNDYLIEVIDTTVYDEEIK